MIATEQTREQAIKLAEKHILDVSTGRLRLGFPPHEVEEYIQEQYRRLRKLKGLE